MCKKIIKNDSIPSKIECNKKFQRYKKPVYTDQNHECINFFFNSKILGTPQVEHAVKVFNIIFHWSGAL